jgi:hypothetical protein
MPVGEMWGRSRGREIPPLGINNHTLGGFRARALSQ